MIITEEAYINTFESITFRGGLSGYLINRKGEIYNKQTHKVLKGTIDVNGYRSYILKTSKGKPVKVFAHIAVARQFIHNDDPRHKTIVNHIDEDKSNSSINNLEWVTPKENANHGTCRKRSGNKRKKPVAEYSLRGEYIRTWASARDVMQFYSELLDYELKSIEESIYGCCKGNCDSAYGRIWRYTDSNLDEDILVDSKIAINSRCSKSKLKLDYMGKVPDEYLYHEMSDKEIYDYFMALEKLTDKEKDMIRKLVNQDYTS